MISITDPRSPERCHAVRLGLNNEISSEMESIKCDLHLAMTSPVTKLRLFCDKQFF
jgi:hypothetical protein